MMATTTCAACGLPPHSGKPLLRCTRCRSVYYHDRECQRAHYRIHRKSCGKDPICSPLIPRLKVTEMEGKGHGVISEENIPEGRLVASFDPLVPPIMFARNRRTHCALCLQPISKEGGAALVSETLKYHVVICSGGCESSSSTTDLIPQWLSEETDAINKALATFYPPNSPVKVLSTAVLIYRIERSGNRAIDEMKIHDPPLSEDAAIHLKACTAQVQQFFLVSDPEKVPSPERISVISRAITFNSFTIVGDNTDEALGFALYNAPSYRMNHSCVPTCRQSFQGIKLLLHSLMDIRSGDEMCIAYFDHEDPKQRREFLKNKYCFDCRCTWCIYQSS